MRSEKMTRRELLRFAGMALAGTALAACSAPAPTPQGPAPADPAGQATQAPAATAAPATAAEISFMMFAWSPESEKFERDRVDLFNKSQSAVVVEPLILPYGEMWTKLDVLVASGQAPDSVWYDYAAYPLIAKGQFLDLKPYVDSEADLLDDKLYDQGFWKPAKMLGDDRPYALPIGGEGMNLFYNNDLFEAAGVPYPTDDLTWDGFLAICLDLTKREGDQTNVFGTSISVLRAWWAWPMLLWARGEGIVDSHYQPGECTLDTPGAIEALQFLQDLVYKHKVAPDPVQASVLAEQGGDFASGRVATLINGAWDVVGFRAIDRFKWDIALLPKGPKGRPSPFWIGGPMISKQSKSRDAAWAWIRWTAEADGQAMIAVSGQQVTWLRSAREILPDGAVPDNYSKRFETLNEVMPADVWSAAWNQVLDKVWNPEFDRFWQGEITAEPLVKKIAPETTQLLQGA
jgi:multiple sugar transport system substrate-binding protein